LHRGAVVRVGRIEDLRSQYRGRYRVYWQGRATEFLEDLRAEGVEILINGQPDQALAIVQEGWSTRTFFALADNRKLVLRGLEPDHEDLEALYHRVLEQ